MNVSVTKQTNPAIPDYNVLDQKDKQRIDLLKESLDFYNVDSIITFGNAQIGDRLAQISEKTLSKQGSLDALIATTLQDLSLNLGGINPAALADATKVGLIHTANKTKSFLSGIVHFFTPETEDQKKLRHAKQTLTEQATKAASIIRQVDYVQSVVKEMGTANTEALKEQQHLNSDVVDHLIAIRSFTDDVTKNKAHFMEDMGEELFTGHFNLLSEKAMTLTNQTVILGSYSHFMRMNQVNLGLTNIKIQQHKEVSVPLWRYQIGQACITLGVGSIAGIVAQMDETTIKIMHETVATQLQSNKMITDSLTNDKTPEEAIKLFAKTTKGLIECLQKIHNHQESLPDRREKIITDFNNVNVGLPLSQNNKQLNM